MKDMSKCIINPKSVIYPGNGYKPVVVVELYLSTLTPSTVADFHGARVPENYFTCRI
jgi:hypothetical protein